MNETIQGPAFRSVGCNSDDDGANNVQHVDMSRTGLFSRLGRIFQSETPPALPKPRPQISPVEELKQQKTLLSHVENQLHKARAILADNPTRPSSTAITAVAATMAQYVKMLQDNVDVAGMPFADVPLLVTILMRPGEGLISTVTQRVTQLETQLRPPAIRSDEYKKVIANALKKMKAAGLSIESLDRFEADEANRFTVGMRHEFRTRRPDFGPNLNHFDRRELRRFAAFVAALPDPE